MVVGPRFRQTIPGRGPSKWIDRVGIHVQQELIPNFVLPAVREPGDDPHAAVVEGKFVTPYGASPRNGPVEAGVRRAD